VVDTLHHRTGVAFPFPDFSKVQEEFDAYRLAIELYYRYYQFYANMFVAIAIAGACRVWSGHRPSAAEIVVVTIIEAVHLVTSRDSLNRYYTRVSQLLGTQAPANAGQAST
jgi:hypothetical protein